MKITKRVVGASFRKTVPIMAGYLVLGFGFGVLLNDIGYGAKWSLLMCFVVFSGSMQFAGIGLIANGASLVTTALTAFMVGARHIFYGLSMVKRYKNTGKKKFYLFYAMSDETYSVLCEDDCPDGEDNTTYMMLITIFNQFYWALGCFSGAILGGVLPFSTKGIEFSMTALFVAIYVSQWLSTKDHVPALLGLLITAACRIICGPEIFLIPSMLVILLILVIMFKRSENGDTGKKKDNKKDNKKGGRLNDCN